jgi:uncharacterized protein YcfJ
MITRATGAHHRPAAGHSGFIQQQGNSLYPAIRKPVQENDMNRIRVLTIVTAMAAAPAFAEPAGVTYEWARVVEKEPVVRVIRKPVQEEVCWQEEVYREVPKSHSRAPVVIGAILGGLIGNQFGSGSGRDAMTVAGAALGGSIAKDNQHRNNPQKFYASLEDRCGMNTNWRETEQIIGWDVVYEYDGETHLTRMQDEPGEYIEVRLEVRPVAR